MSEDFTPATEQVRDGYAIDVEGEYGNPVDAGNNRKWAERAFDRWLAEVKASAWDEGWDAREKLRNEPAIAKDFENPFRLTIFQHRLAGGNK